LSTLLHLFSFARNGALMAILAHGLIGISLVWDKVLLKNPGTRNLFSYVFWLGAMSALGVLLIPFGYRSAPIAMLGLAFATGVIHLVGVYFYYAALKRGEASETLAIMGGFSPVATAAIAFALLSKQMSPAQLLGFALMTGGGFAMFFSEKLPLKRLLPPVLLASGLLGLVNVLEKIVYDHTNFVTGYVWFTLGTFAGALGLLAPRSWRRQILAESGGDNPRNRFWYFVNRFVSGVGSFLLFYAISLAHPAIVDAISGVRYAMIFVGALLLTKLRPQWLKENFRGWQLFGKVTATALVVAGLVMVGMAGGGQGDSGSTAQARRRFRRVVGRGGAAAYPQRNRTSTQTLHTNDGRCGRPVFSAHVPL
jgi:drug/metabolite transporter (DMT)-like permease